MYLTHDQGQEKIVDFLLQNWRSGKNLNHYISQNIERITPPADWPAPDAYFQVPDKKSKIAIEYNGEIVAKCDYKKKYLKKNDKLEIVHFIGGG